jgi:hypothetical protein
MSEIRANSITDAAGTGAPDFPNGLEIAGVALQSGVGDGQTWQAVTRSINTVYQNTLSKPIVASYTGTAAAASGSVIGLRIEVAASTPPTIAVAESSTLGFSSYTTVSAIIPPGHYYRFSDISVFQTPVGAKFFRELR